MKGIYRNMNVIKRCRKDNKGAPLENKKISYTHTQRERERERERERKWDAWKIGHTQSNIIEI